MMKTAVLLQMSLLLFVASGRADRARRYLDDNEGERQDLRGDIRSPRVTDWGEWSDWDMCPPESFVVGMKLKMESVQHNGDDTALNGIRLTCMKDQKLQGQISGNVAQWGNWLEEKRCSFSGTSASYITGFSLRSEEAQGEDEDDTAANNLEVYCDDGETLTGEGRDSGDWSASQQCPSGTAVCGLRTQVEDPQGPEEDETALNNVDMRCCYLS
uniref:Uncharacterized protein n=1 Tax=Plectus sambesii TaxID=2011161 RepID=A0A914X8R9_9BILA